MGVIDFRHCMDITGFRGTTKRQHAAQGDLYGGMRVRHWHNAHVQRPCQPSPLPPTASLAVGVSLLGLEMSTLAGLMSDRGGREAERARVG